MSPNFNLSGLNSAQPSTGAGGSAVSFQGLSSGIQTNALVQAQITRASQPMVDMQNQVSADAARSGALSTLSSNLTALSTALGTLNDSGFQSRTVSSSDGDGTYVTATAQGSAPGKYDIQVNQVATSARLMPTMGAPDPVTGVSSPTNLAVDAPDSPIFQGDSATFAIQGTDGVTQQLTLNSTSNNIYALADAINALQTPDPGDPGSEGLGVTATVVNTGGTDSPYQLVLNSKQTGIGDGGDHLTIADITPGGPANTLGIAAGALSADEEDIAYGGTQSNQPASNALFTLDGIQMERTSNKVTDAVDGVTFNLLQGGQTGTTTLTVTQDTDTAANDMTNVVSAYNTMMQAYSAASAAGGPLSGDSSSHALVGQVARALSGTPSGLGLDSTFNSAASLGLSTNQDGTLSLNTATFQKALKQDPAAAMNVFASAGTTTNPVVSFQHAGPNTVTGALDFNITSYTSGGPIQGTVTGPDGTPYALSGSNGTLSGAAGTPLEGLYLNVSGTGSGTLNISRGVGQATQDAIAALTAYGTGGIAALQKGISADTTRLNTQIANQQKMLNTMQTSLQDQYSKMESAVGKLQAAGSSLGSLS